MIAGNSQTRPSPLSSSEHLVSKVARIPQIVFGEDTARFFRESTTSGDVLNMGFPIWPAAFTTPTPMPARREGTGTCHFSLEHSGESAGTCVVAVAVAVDGHGDV